MEINQIRQFRVIARTESISKAAEMLYITQPSLSQSLRRLETELGTPLFDRHGKRIELNGAGKIFLRYCDEIAAALDNAQSEINEYIGSEKADINILVESSTLMILEVAEKMRKQYPWSLPHFYQGFCGSWDLKIFSDICPDCGTLSRMVIEEPIGVILPREHALVRKDAVTKKDLENRDFLSLGRTDALTKTVSHFCSQADFKPKITMFADSPAVMTELLERNFGMAFAPRCTWYGYYGKELVFRLVEDMPMRQFIHIALNDKKRVSQATRRCYDAIAGFYQEYGKKFSS